MTTWTTSSVPRTCGGCGRRVKDDAMLTYQLPRITRPLLRCQACTDQEPPRVREPGEDDECPT